MSASTAKLRALAGNKAASNIFIFLLLDIPEGRSLRCRARVARAAVARMN
jgi:hypothetical protein